MSEYPRLLVVDDNANTLFAMSRLLKKAGYEVFQASTGSECLKLSREKEPDLILLDVILPDINGIELCRQIKAEADLASIMVILLSSLMTGSEQQTDGLEAGADGYIARPIPNDELLARLKAYLRLKRAEDSLREYSERLEQIVAERTKALRDAQEQLVRKEKLAALGQMAGGIAHELRGPLSVITNALYLLQTKLTDKTAQGYLDLINEEVNDAAHIITGLLDFAHTAPAERGHHPISDLLTQVFERHPAPETVTVITRLPPDLPPVFVDPRQIKEVLYNLVFNAYQAMPEGGSLTITAAPEDHAIKLAIMDTGSGIPPENMTKLFEPLFTTKGKGIGLGLAVSKLLVETNGGSIEVQSETGKGSTFTLILPVEEVII